ncbi:hypothetical protein GCM10022243_29940 [Saccharothrix violaceirubra]|uniref:Putative membrane protein n=1 Tax=Saccharothrix violaceirubra TaxID=413306 RepID=A0A7W7WXH3_9PSEU|nr:hypothetical protein [Saccharothrix violaceirubra]MBB4966618.1 putative membrane protein [Saccharothrix violaceirubra]
MQLALVLAATAALTTSPAAPATVTEILPPAGYRSVSAYALNDAGQIAGTAYPESGPGRAHLWHGGAVTALGVGAAVAIGRNGHVIISEFTGTNGRVTQKVFLYHDGVRRDISPPGEGYAGAGTVSGNGTVPMSYSDSAYSGNVNRVGVRRGGRFAEVTIPDFGPQVGVRAVNDGGEFVGSTYRTSAFRCDAEDVCTRLPVPPGVTDPTPNALNESGVVVGYGFTAAGQVPLRWDHAGVTVLHDGPGAPAGREQAVNERGDVVGWRQVDGVRRATLWRDGAAVDLGRPGEEYSETIAVNDLGQVVGRSRVDGREVAWVWHRGRYTVLPSLGGAWTSPMVINNTGTVVGTAVDAEGRNRAVRWTIRTW